ncbi:nuclear transport factor 2 family protein [Mycobacterium sp. 3519A]|uniref:nuclear transport factor 2 family protein n=1 Tax=Mycobacterium sp. 3519A TaxID=2057184 RepID=UPI000C7E2265|nr:nuclear transport factor 2 family protein [Mycobacterium sp. 3519A]
MRDLFHRYADVWGSHDPDAIIALHTDDTRFHAHIGQEPAHGKAAVRQAFADLLAQFPDLGFEQVSLITGSDFWVVEWMMTGTLAATGAQFEVDVIDLITVENGRVRTKDSYLDAVSMQAQLGLAVAQ